MRSAACMLALRALSCPGDVEGGPVVDGRADDRQPAGHVDGVIGVEQLDRDVALVVVHGDHEVVATRAGGPEDGVARQRPGHVGARGPQALDRRPEHTLLLLAEQAALAGMGIEAGHRQARRADPQPAEQLGGDAHHGLQALGRDPARDLLEGDVGRHVRHPQLRTHEQHRHLRAVAEVGQQLGVPGVLVSRPPHRLLVERRRGQGVDPARERRPGGGADRGHRQLAALGAHLAVRRRFDRLGHRMDEDPPRPRVVSREIGVERELELARGDLARERGPRPEHHGTAALVQAGLPQRLERDLGPDARRIAHGDGHPRSRHALATS